MKQTAWGIPLRAVFASEGSAEIVCAARFLLLSLRFFSPLAFFCDL